MSPRQDSGEGRSAGVEASVAAKKGLGGRLWGGTLWIASAPLRLLPREEIVKNADLIRGLIDDVKRGHRRRQTLRVVDDRSFDMAATAFYQGVSVMDLEALLWRRRRSTARAAYIAFGFGWLFFLGWLYRLTHTQWSAGFILTALQFAPFCAVFFLLAFKSALENYQIRTRRLASAMEYLQTNESFWPS
jgi:hypothetical protein